MPIGYASVRVNITSFVVDGIDSDDLPDDAPLTAKLTLTPMISVGKTLQYKDGGRNKLKAVAPIQVDIGASGDISHQGRDFVKVVAPTAVETNLARLQWRADFSDVRLGGSLAAVKIDPIYFWVDPDVEINLADHVNVAASTAVPLTRGQRGFGVVGFTSVDGDLVPLFESADGVVEGDPISLAGVVSDGAVSGLITDEGSATGAVLKSTYAPRWKPDTAYAGGIAVLLPDGTSGTRTSTGTSRPTFDATEKGRWTVTAGGLDSAALATELANPETAANSAVVGIVTTLVPPAVEYPVNFSADVATARPAWPGPVRWETDHATAVPVHIADNDVIRRLSTTVIAWTPAALPNLHTWVSAQQGSYTADSAVTQWNDLSGHGHHFKQSIEANRPLYRATALGGKPALEFDGTSDMMLTDAFTPSVGEAWTVYLVGQSTPATLTGGSDFFIDALASNGTSATRLAVYRSTASTVVISRGTAIGSPPALDNALHRIKAVFSGGSSSVKVDAGTAVTGTTSLSGIDVAQLSIGGRSDGANWLQGYLGEVVWVKGTVSVDDDEKMTTYLQSKWGVA